MRVLLDECLPRRLKRKLVGHDARTAPEMGWASKRNGELLRLAVDGEFDAFLTVDRKLQHQQNLSAFNIAVVVLARQQQQQRGRGPAAADAEGARTPSHCTARTGDRRERP